MQINDPQLNIECMYMCADWFEQWLLEIWSSNQHEFLI